MSHHHNAYDGRYQHIVVISQFYNAYASQIRSYQGVSSDSVTSASVTRMMRYISPLRHLIRLFPINMPSEPVDNAAEELSPPSALPPPRTEWRRPVWVDVYELKEALSDFEKKYYMLDEELDGEEYELMEDLYEKLFSLVDDFRERPDDPTNKMYLTVWFGEAVLALNEMHPFVELSAEANREYDRIDSDYRSIMNRLETM